MLGAWAYRWGGDGRGPGDTGPGFLFLLVRLHHRGLST
jgi:hypothetical protein